MDYRKGIFDLISSLVSNHPANRLDGDDFPYFEGVLVGVADGDDELFHSYKEIIGPFHLTPGELFEEEYGEGSFKGGTVISWVLPVALATRKDNRREKEFPSRSWARTRDYGEKFNRVVRLAVVDKIRKWGFRAVAPMESPAWKKVDDPGVGIASTWSERHAAYVAGLGTFSLNDGLITERGMAHRLGSVVTDIKIASDSMVAGDYRSNCLKFAGKKCGVCIERCPADAISEVGHDKQKCSVYTYGVALQAVKDEYDVSISGCGLCQTGVPCEARNPVKRD